MSQLTRPKFSLELYQISPLVKVTCWNSEMSCPNHHCRILVVLYDVKSGVMLFVYLVTTNLTYVSLVCRSDGAQTVD